MSAQEAWGAAPRWPGRSDAVLRRRNGSIDIKAYAALAHRQRALAVTASLQSAFRLIGTASAAIIGRRLPQRAAAAKPCA